MIDLVKGEGRASPSPRFSLLKSLPTQTWFALYLRQLFTYWTLQVFAPDKLLRLKYEAFKELLHQEAQVDWARVETLVCGPALVGCPQDLEWCQDKQGRLFLFQSRPLKPSPMAGADLQEAKGSPEVAQPVVLHGGVTGSPGLGIGKVWLVRREAELREVPEGAVLVSPTLPPAFAVIIDRPQAAVADGGSRAGHFAVVAREYGLPVMKWFPANLFRSFSTIW